MATISHLKRTSRETASRIGDKKRTVDAHSTRSTLNSTAITQPNNRHRDRDESSTIDSRSTGAANKPSGFRRRLLTFLNSSSQIYFRDPASLLSRESVASLGASYHTAVTSSSGASLVEIEVPALNPSITDAFNDTPMVPNLGTMLRPPFRRVNQGGGLVFGRPLADCVRDTKSSRPYSDSNKFFEESIEARYIPALVLRCVQHIERWGLKEEGLFRIPGRETHIDKLRVEFASGADYNLQECKPVDLDPHAVVSILKTFIRKLPEPILTRMRAPLFDAALAGAETACIVLSRANTITLPSPGRNSAGARHDSIGALNPSPAPQSTSTITPADPVDILLQPFRMLILSLPRENRDLLLTIVELLKKAAAESNATKMPLDKLLLVLCPCVGIDPKLLKVFVEHSLILFRDK